MLDQQRYIEAIAEARVGKRVGRSLYVHESALRHLPRALQDLALTATQHANALEFRFNVFKFGTIQPALSLLHYPRIFDDGFPTLEASAQFDVRDLALGAVRRYDGATRPILHRKELLLAPEDSRIQTYATLTATAETLGLFRDLKRIGSSCVWNELLKSRGLEVVNHQLVKTDGSLVEPKDEQILRYRTALARSRLSVPVKSLCDLGFLVPGVTFFDYGCGRGDDVKFLQALGVDAKGWDPHFFPGNDKDHADFVNLGYVLNVIEDPSERLEVLREAFWLADRALIVSVLVGTPKHKASSTRHADGTLTSTKTFQKYFDNEELSALVSAATESEAHSLSRGVVLVFRSPEEEQQYLQRRLLRRRTKTPTCRARKTVHITLHHPVMEEFWKLALELGRAPLSSELTADSDVRPIFGQPKAVLRRLLTEETLAEFEAARSARRDDLLVQTALSFFDRQLLLSQASASLRVDIREFFGGIQRLTALAKALLFRISDVDSLAKACHDAADEGIGYLLKGHSLQVHVSLLERLSPILRVYVGCADVLCNELDHSDLVKIHINSGKVTFLTYDDFAESALPELRERTKVHLWQRKVEYFDYIGPHEPKLLLLKSLFVGEDFPGFKQQAAFDRQLMRAKTMDLAFENMSRREFHTKLQERGLYVDGFEILPTLDTACSAHFTFRDFIECSETFQNGIVDNRPRRRATYEAMQLLAERVLEPVIETFGELKLTFGFCGPILASAVPRGISPRIDQHAAHELTSDGEPVCARKGFACDFLVPGKSSLSVAQWIVRNCPFDRMYYYGDDRPIHVSLSHEPTRTIIEIRRRAETKRIQPIRRSEKSFLNLTA